MADQQTLDGTPVPFNPLAHGLASRYVHRLTIDHGAWLRACAEGVTVGSCRHCGSPLRPIPPHDRGNGSFDYEAVCGNELRSTMDGRARQTSGCGKSILCPRGRVLYRSGLASERPAEDPS